MFLDRFDISLIIVHTSCFHATYYVYSKWDLLKTFQEWETQNLLSVRQFSLSELMVAVLPFSSCLSKEKLIRIHITEFSNMSSVWGNSSYFSAIQKSRAKTLLVWDLICSVQMRTNPQWPQFHKGLKTSYNMD